MLLDLASIVLVPVLPSPLVEASTRRLITRLAELKPMRKGRRRLMLVANRARSRSRAARRLDGLLSALGHPVAGRLSDRAIYAELAGRGQGLFDARTPTARAAQAEWAPLLQAGGDARGLGG
jgi:chromosome partitioning protein